MRHSDKHLIGIYDYLARTTFLKVSNKTHTTAITFQLLVV